MNAKTVRVVTVHNDAMCSPEGWTVPEGWRIVHSEFIGGNRWRVTIVC